MIYFQNVWLLLRRGFKPEKMAILALASWSNKQAMYREHHCPHQVIMIVNSGFGCRCTVPGPMNAAGNYRPEQDVQNPLLNISFGLLKS